MPAPKPPKSKKSAAKPFSFGRKRGKQVEGSTRAPPPKPERRTVTSAELDTLVLGQPRRRSR